MRLIQAEYGTQSSKFSLSKMKCKQTLDLFRNSYQQLLDIFLRKLNPYWVIQNLKWVGQGTNRSR